MTGSLQIKKGRKNYYAVLNVYDDAGKRKPKWIDTDVPVKGNNKRKAESKLKELLAMYSENRVDLSKDVAFIDFMKLWLETLRVSIALSTYDAYKMTLDVHFIPYFEGAKLRVTDVTPAHIQQYVTDKLKSVSSNTVRKHLSNLSTCLESAVTQYIIPFNPVKRMKWPRR